MHAEKMNTRTTAGLKIFLACAGLLAAAVPVQADPGEITSTAKDQKGLSLTIYNNDLALIKDRRAITLPAGNSTLAFREVSGRMRPETALLTGGLEILEQNFEYDLLTPESLLAKYVGREVSMIQRHPTTGEELPPQEALVLSAGPGGVVLKAGERIETGISGRLVYPDVPPNLRDRPTLTMQVASEEPGSREVELSYLSSGLTWQADYVAELNNDERQLNFKGWVSLTNESGASYNNAQLQLVAGEVNVVEDARQLSLETMAVPAPMAAASKKAMTEEAMFEYHLYTLERPTTILENQKKQVALLQADGVLSKKEFILRGSDYYYRGQADNLGERQDVGVELEVKNEKERGLGMPIPAGVVRVYKKDSRGFLQFVGEDRIEHTPDKEIMRLRLGTAFDVTAEKKQTSFRKISGIGPYNYNYESSYQITIKNAKDEAVQVKVLEPIPGDWKIVSESQAHTKESAHSASWLVDVPAKGSTALSYSAEVRF